MTRRQPSPRSRRSAPTLHPPASAAAQPASPPNLLLGAEADSEEREADQTADRVLNLSPGADGLPARGAGPPVVRRRQRAGGRGPVDVDWAVGHVLDADPGERLDPATRAVMSRGFGTDLGHVLVHSGPRAAASAAALGARAYTVGEHVVFGHGAYAPAATDGRRLLAHELAHVVQNGSGTGMPMVRRQPAKGAGPGPSFAGIYPGADPLAPYTALRRLSPSTHAALAVTARRKTLRLSTDVEPEAPDATGTVEVVLPVRTLVLPPVPSGPLPDLRSRLWPLVAEQEPNQDEIAEVLQDELTGRWAGQNESLLAAPVRIRLLEPEQLAAPVFVLGQGGLEVQMPPVLSFDIAGEPVSSQDGSLALIELDLLGSNTLEQLAARVGEDATVVARAGDLLRASTGVLDVEAAFWEKVRSDPDAVSANEVEAHFALFTLNVGEGPPAAPLLWQLTVFLEGHPEYEPELGEAARRVGELQRSVWEDHLRYREYLQAELASPDISSTMREGVDRTWVTARELREEGVAEGALGYAVAGMTEGLYYLMNMFSAGYPDTRHDAVRAFRRGDISYDQLEELTAAATGRGAIVGLVSLALAGVTAGLAGPLLGTAATLGRQVLFNAAAGGIGGVLTAGTTSAISHLRSYEDPTMDQIWGQGRLGPGQILASGLLGAGIGAASVPVGIAFGKLVAWGRGAPRGPAGGPPPTAPPGWVAEQVTDDLVRYTAPDVPGEFIVGRGSIRYQVPTGTGMRVVADMPMSRLGGPPPPAAPAGAVPPRPALPSQAGQPAGLVWLNPRSGVYHPPGSRWYGRTAGGRYATVAEAQAEGFRQAGQFSPTGVYATERPPLGEPRVVVRSKLGPRQARRGYERDYASAAEYGLQEIAGWERAHSQGAGLGAEAQAAIRLATKQVNQQLQRNGVERTMREMVAQLAPGEELHLTTTTTTHQGTLRLKEIQYQLYRHRPGLKPELVFEVAIELSRAGRARTTAELVGTMAQELARAPADGGSAPVPAAAALRALADRSPGRPLARDLERASAPPLSLELAGVRIHDDAAGASLAAAVSARAFTRGSHIYFAHGEFDPGSRAGRRLLSHELAHVLQQRRDPATSVPPATARGREQEAAARADA